MSAPSQATILVDIASVIGIELFHDDRTAYATIPVADHQETWPLKVSGFRNWLAQRFHDSEGSAPNTQSLQAALGVLAGRALYNGPERRVYTRLAAAGDSIYLDLGNASWEAVCINPGGWALDKNPPVRFRRVRGMQALPRPEPGNPQALAVLRSFLNVDPADWPLVLGYVISAFRPTGPYPVLMLHGEQGTAKSTVLRIIRALLDPNTAAVRSEPRDERDLMIAATNGWVVALDNVSRLPDWLSDAICRLVTGGGFATRELYTDQEEVLLDAMRPVMVNGIEELAVRGDLLDRAIICYLPVIPDSARRPEDEFWADFQRARPTILGALLDIVSTAQRNLPAVRLATLPRMADFGKWITAAQPAVPNGTITMLDAYINNRSAAHDLVLSASPLVPYLKTLPAQWEGTAGELLAALNAKTDDATRRSKAWPDSPRSLSNAVRRLVPNLRASGIEVAFSQSGGKGNRRLLTVTRDDALQGGSNIVTTVTTATDRSAGNAGNAGNAEMSDSNEGRLFDEAGFLALQTAGRPVDDEAVDWD